MIVQSLAALALGLFMMIAGGVGAQRWRGKMRSVWAWFVPIGLALLLVGLLESIVPGFFDRENETASPKASPSMRTSN